MSASQYLRRPPPLTSLFSPTPTFPRGLVDQVVAPVCVVVAVAVVAIPVITIVAVVTVITIVILMAQCDEFTILVNALDMWLSCPDTRCSDKPCVGDPAVHVIRSSGNKCTLGVFSAHLWLAWMTQTWTGAWTGAWGSWTGGGRVQVAFVQWYCFMSHFLDSPPH